MDAKTRLITSEFKQVMQGNRFARVVLLGSYARNTYRGDSDIDFMVVLNDETISRLDEINRFLKTQSGLSLKHNMTVSILPVSHKNTGSWHYPFTILPA